MTCGSTFKGAPVYTFADLETDPQLAHNGMLVSYDHPTAGSVRTLGIPVEFSGTPSGIRLPAPLLGQHTTEVLQELLGRDVAQLQALKEGKVI